MWLFGYTRVVQQDEEQCCVLTREQCQGLRLLETGTNCLPVCPCGALVCDNHKHAIVVFEEVTSRKPDQLLISCCPLQNYVVDLRSTRCTAASLAQVLFV